MTWTFATDRLVPAHRVVTRVVGGATVLLNARTGATFSLDEVGTIAWRHLTTKPSLRAAYDALLAEYDVDEVTLRRDLEDLIGRLVSSGLATIVRA